MDDQSAREAWEERYRGSERVWSGHPNTALVSVVEKTLAEVEPGHALDVGCGEGGDVLFLAARGWDATGLDLSATAIQRARTEAAARGLDTARFEVGEVVEWARGRAAGFDLVTASFLHTAGGGNRVEALRAATTLVAPGGRMLVVSHAAMPPWALARHHGEGHDRPDEHLTPAGERAALALGAGWDTELAEVRPRDATGPDGEHAELQDSILLLRRTA